MGRAYAPVASRFKLHRALALAGVCYLVYALYSRGDSRGEDDAGDAEADSYGGFGFATLGGSTGGGVPRRALHPHELCSWETSVESSTFDKVVDKEGWPSHFEQMVAESQPIKPVFCPVCGAAQQTIKFGGLNVREEGRCSHCKSFNRLRQMAEVALPEVWRMTGRSFRSLNELVLTDLAIYNTQCAGVLHNLLSSATGYVCSEFVSAEVEGGTVVRGLRHEDLQRTSFKDGSFDIVLSTEMMSRVSNPYQAHYEIRRILKPGGSHIFTVPFMPSDYHDQVRASVEDGRLVHHVQPPIYTGDRLHPKGLLLFTIFGKEMVDKMCMLGYNVTAHHLHNGAHGIIGENAWVFVATKKRQ